jgi:hypothetical protein
MSAEDLTTGIAALEDDDVRTAVAAGDLSAFAQLDLTDEEIGLLEAAASDYPDVVGFDIRAGLFGLGQPAAFKGNLFDVSQDVTVNKAKTADKAYTQMDGYIKQ